MVRVLPSLSYADAHREMMEADVLMLFQGPSCNAQIPAKVYEYLYVGRPILALTDPEGDTGRLLAELGIRTTVPIDDVSAIKGLILQSIKEADNGTAYVPPRESIMGFSRSGTTEKLADLLNEVSGPDA
jgi:hypothetical protein